MKKVLFAGAALFTAAIVSTTAFEGRAPIAPTSSQLAPTSGQLAPTRSRVAPLAQSPAPSAVGAGLQAGPAQSVADFQPMVAKYCFTCHNTRNPLPAGLPLALDKANFADPGAD